VYFSRVPKSLYGHHTVLSGTVQRISGRISKDTWDSTVISVVILLVHEDLFLPLANHVRELGLRDIIRQHGLHKIVDQSDRVFRLVSIFNSDMF